MMKKENLILEATNNISNSGVQVLFEIDNEHLQHMNPVELNNYIRNEVTKYYEVKMGKVWQPKDELLSWLNDPTDDWAEERKYIYKGMSRREIDNLFIGANTFTCFKVFLKMAKYLKGKDYWYALRNAYTITDNLFQYKKEIRKAFKAKKTGKSELMKPNEHKYLAKLPDTIKIYRGMTKAELDSGHFGISWTLKKSVANFFANDYQRNYYTNGMAKTVHFVEIPKSDVVAIFNCRKEFEIICLG